jgi:hypothetical protein
MRGHDSLYLDVNGYDIEGPLFQLFLKIDSVSNFLKTASLKNRLAKQLLLWNAKMSGECMKNYVFGSFRFLDKFEKCFLRRGRRSSFF